MAHAKRCRTFLKLAAKWSRRVYLSSADHDWRRSFRVLRDLDDLALADFLGLPDLLDFPDLLNLVDFPGLPRQGASPFAVLPPPST